MNSDTFRWGILGPGKIARKFASALPHSPGALLAAVGSRSAERAAAFAADYGAARAHGSYESLAADPDIDAVYVATPHSEHLDGALLAIAHGKPVLVEKPVTINAREARRMVDAARAAGVFCMEGMWTRFFPVMREIKQRVAGGDIGVVGQVQADFGFLSDYDPASRLFDLRLGGGALLDVGIYPLSLASFVLGAPERVAGSAHLAPSGADDIAAIALGYAGGATALLSTATRLDTPKRAAILGDAGAIHLAAEWWKPSGYTLRRPGRPDEIVERPYAGTGFQFEADELQRCVRAGLTESEVMPLDESLRLMETMDALRREWGVVYPADAA